MSELVLEERAGAVATLTLSEPAKANVLSLAMMDALSRSIARCAAEEAVHVIIIAAAGRLFCAGHDLGELKTRANDRAETEALFQRCAQLMADIRHAPKPIIAKVQGTAVAAGCQLVAACDLAYAADHAKFGVNGIDLGLFCSTPSVALSRAMPPRQALELALTGDLIPAARAVELGLINAAVPAAALNETVSKVAEKIAGKDSSAIALGKRAFWQQHGANENEAYALAGRAMAENLSQAATQEMIGRFLTKQK